MEALDSYRRVLVVAADYSYEGEVVTVFSKRRGQMRCVVEDDNGRLFIHNSGQLAHLKPVPAGSIEVRVSL
jgi:hypothetical protein